MPTREEMQTLGGEIIRSYEDRIVGIAQLRVAVKTQLKEFDDAHAAMSREMRVELNKGRQALTEEEAKRQSEAREFMGELGRAVAEGKTAVKAQLKEFGSTHNDMSREMRATLARGRQILAKQEKERQSEARQFMGELARTVTEGKAAAQSLLRNFSEVQAGARDAWQELTATIQSKRGGVAVAVKPPVEKIGALRNQVFQYLANHPDGARLVELEQEFGVARIQMAKVVRSLMDENKVKKRALYYFAI